MYLTNVYADTLKLKRFELRDGNPIVFQCHYQSLTFFLGGGG